ncbi:MAG: hypothetical protein CRN43_11370 [Candidatus Nephrothrix sp. EaCA]|nr:MAG: hypothetical protein CRN43_11370 [Candidatus Nephrothrix sp. EaCA]
MLEKSPKKFLFSLSMFSWQQLYLVLALSFGGADLFWHKAAVRGISNTHKSGSRLIFVFMAFGFL